MDFEIEGMDKLISDIELLGKVPQRHVTSSAKKGMNIVLKNARGAAPYETGELKKGMILKGERSRVRGKKVYQIVFDPSKNDIFQTVGKNGDVVGYYPVSQEYGFFAKDGRYIPGYRFLRDSLEERASDMEKTIVNEMQKKIEGELRKAGL